MITDTSEIRKVYIAKIQATTGVLGKYFMYQTGPSTLDFNTKDTVGVVKRM
jgi:hypothetical protein